MWTPDSSGGTGPFSEETRTWVKAHGNWGVVRPRCSIHWAAVDKGLQLTTNPVQEACQPRASPGCSIYRLESRGTEKLRYLSQLIYSRKILSSSMSLPSVSCYFLLLPWPWPGHGDHTSFRGHVFFFSCFIFYWWPSVSRFWSPAPLLHVAAIYRASLAESRLLHLTEGPAAIWKTYLGS